MANKQFFLNARLTVTKKDAGGDQESDTLVISGYASTNDKDRHGDVIEAGAWSKPSALKNYLENPIILAYHDHKQPIGKMVEHTVDDKGLHIVAEISKAAGNVYELIKDGILGTFSVGFMIKDADWDSQADIFRIKEVELFETSVVTIPANASATFSVGKSFDSEDEYTIFKQQFETTINEEDNHMADAIDNKTVPGLSAQEVAAIVAKSLADRDAVQAAEKAAKEQTAALVSGAVKDAVEQLEADMAAKLEAASGDEAKFKATIAEIAEQAAGYKDELEALRKNKMSWNGANNSEINKEERDIAMLLSKCLNINVEKTAFGAALIEKAGANVPNADWEEEFNTGILMELREQLKIEPLFRKVLMNTPSLRFPVNPEAAFAEWVTGSKGTASGGADGDLRTGAAQDQALTEIILTSKTLATKSYIGYEEEEDAILPIMPIVRDALVRRMARASDLSFLMGTASGITGAASGVTGLAQFANNTITLQDSDGAPAAEFISIQDLLNARKRLGRHGLDTSNLVYLVNIEGFYALLEENDGSTGGATFQTMDKVGDKATLLTGQLAAIGGVPLIVTEAFPATGVNAAMAACVYLPNYLLGEQRSMKVEQDTSIEFQTKILVATRRMAFQEIETGLGTEFVIHGAS